MHSRCGNVLKRIDAELRHLAGLVERLRERSNLAEQGLIRHDENPTRCVMRRDREPLHFPTARLSAAFDVVRLLDRGSDHARSAMLEHDDARLAQDVFVLLFELGNGIEDLVVEVRRRTKENDTAAFVPNELRFRCGTAAAALATGSTATFSTIHFGKCVGDQLGVGVTHLDVTPLAGTLVYVEPVDDLADLFELYLSRLNGHQVQPGVGHEARRVGRPSPAGLSAVATLTLPRSAGQTFLEISDQIINHFPHVCVLERIVPRETVGYVAAFELADQFTDEIERRGRRHGHDRVGRLTAKQLDVLRIDAQAVGSRNVFLKNRLR